MADISYLITITDVSSEVHIFFNKELNQYHILQYDKSIDGEYERVLLCQYCQVEDCLIHIDKFNVSLKLIINHKLIREYVSLCLISEPEYFIDNTYILSDVVNHPALVLKQYLRESNLNLIIDEIKYQT